MNFFQPIVSLSPHIYSLKWGGGKGIEKVLHCRVRSDFNLLTALKKPSVVCVRSLMKIQNLSSAFGEQALHSKLIIRLVSLPLVFIYLLKSKFADPNHLCKSKHQIQRNFLILQNKMRLIALTTNRMSLLMNQVNQLSPLRSSSAVIR